MDRHYLILLFLSVMHGLSVCQLVCLITDFLIDCLTIDIFLNSFVKGSVFYYFPDPRFYLKGQHL